MYINVIGGHVRNITKYLTTTILLMIFTGCAEHTLKVLPELQPQTLQLQPVNVKIEYAGNKEYLPNVLKEDNSSGITATYLYSVKYTNGSTDWDGLNLFNPLLFVGFPLSEEAVIVEGKLTLISVDDINQTFTSSCIASKTRSLYQNGGSSGPRKGCLLAVRDNINNQIIKFISGERK